MRIATACAAMALTGCTVVTVVPSGTGVTAPPRESGCAVPVLRTAPADRPFDELASLHYTTRLSSEGDPASAQAAFQERACELGADAVLVVRDFVPGALGGSGGGGMSPVMTGVAIRFRRPAAAAAGGSAP